MDLILASKSPRRRELLTQIGVRFEVLGIDIPEYRDPSESPEQYVRRLALQKSAAGALERPNLPVLGADTVVVLNGQLFEKPKDKAEAMAMLAQLSGRHHQVLTAVALTLGDRQQASVCSTEVTFREILPVEAEHYWSTGEPADKAGGYAIQGFGAVFVASLQGSYSNVVGLPLLETHQLLAQFRVPVWKQKSYE